MQEAIKNEDLKAVNALIKAGVDVNARDNDGLMALHYAVELHIYNNNNYIYRHSNEWSKWQQMEYVRHEAILANIVKALIAAGADVNTKDELGWTALIKAADNMDEAMVKILLKAGADVNVRALRTEYGEYRRDLTALYYAYDYDDQPYEDDAPPQEVFDRLEASSRRIVKALIAAGADVNAKNDDGETPLMWSTDETTVKALIKAGADVNARDRKGRTPLMYQYSPKVDKVLIDAGADVHARDAQGMTALHHVSSRDDDVLTHNTCKALLKAGADPNVKDNEGKTALMIASQGGHAEVVMCLLSARVDVNNRVDVNARDAQGMTALMISARDWQPDWSPGRDGDPELKVMKALLKAGADVHAKDNEGKTALDWARTEEVKALLRKSGAK